MQSLKVNNPDLPDLQFVLLVLALCTSDIPTLNVPEDLRHTLFDRCWALLHDSPPPVEKENRVLDLRQGDEVTLEALVEVIQRTFNDSGITRLTWDHAPSEPTRSTTPEALPLIERLQQLYPDPPESLKDPSGSTDPTSNP